MSQRECVGAVADFPPGAGREVVAGSRVVAVFNVEGRFFALDAVCPHAGGPLAQGRILDGVLSCPWHGWQFRLDTGRNCLNPNIGAGCYHASVEAGQLYLELPD